MQMTENEIVSKYVRNGKENHQIEILADLNAVSKEAIKEILIRNGVMAKRSSMTRKVKYAVNEAQITEILNLHNDGYSAPRISNELNIAISAVRRTLKAYKNDSQNNEKLPEQNSTEGASAEIVVVLDSAIAETEKHLKELKELRSKLNQYLLESRPDVLNL